MSINSNLSDILVCPKCMGDLEHEEDSVYLTCNECELQYHVKNGIPIMLIDSADSYSE